MTKAKVKAAPRTEAEIKLSERVLNVRPDTLDFRDIMYVPTLIEVPTEIPLSEYKSYKIPILNQGKEGACTGFGLATVANYLLTRRKVVPDPTPVSPRMLYELARRHDEWPGEDYEGSSARGAMKGWHKYGVCSEERWPYKATEKDGTGFTDEKTKDAIRRPLGAYFRVNHKDLVAMHSAISEVGVLYATASVHEGWGKVDASGMIPYLSKIVGGHAFAIVAYDEHGFWIQNSWGEHWGLNGFACISYDDWLANGTDVWVARLGAPIILNNRQSSSIAHSASAGESSAYAYGELRPHIVSIGGDGKLKPGGDYGTTASEVKYLFSNIPNMMESWKKQKTKTTETKKRILLYAHGGLVGERPAVQRLSDYRPSFLDNDIYPISFIWHTDAWTTITNILTDTINRRRPAGSLDGSKDFMLDRLDDALEPLVRKLAGKTLWDEMKKKALEASKVGGGTRFALDCLADLMQSEKNIELHLVGHSAGSIFHAPIVRLLTSKGKISSGFLAGEQGYGLTISSCTLWAPACTVDLFKQAYLPAIRDQTLKNFSLFTLSDKAEQDDNCAGIYNKSLLYLVSNALEATPRIPAIQGGRDGVPLLGMQKFIDSDPELCDLFANGAAKHVIAPNNGNLKNGIVFGSGALHHGDFDDDKQTVMTTLTYILNRLPLNVDLKFQRSGESKRDLRTRIDNKTMR